MRAPTTLHEWIERLARMVLAWGERRRSRQALTIKREGDAYVMAGGADDKSARRFPACGPLAADVRDRLRGRFIVCELPADRVVVRTVKVPARAREFVSGIVRNQIERLAPWPADQVAYGFLVASGEGDGASLDVPVVMTARAVIDAACAELAALGIVVDRVVAPARSVQNEAMAPLWSRAADVARDELRRTSRALAAGLAALVVLSLGLSAWAFAAAASVRGETEEVSARIADLRHPGTRAAGGPSAAPLGAAERAWAAKQNAPSAVVLIEFLSRALPDTAYLTELSVQNGSVRIVGLTKDAPSLLPPLEQSGHFKGAHFFAPTTRGPGGELYWFHIEARADFALELAQD